MKTIRLANTLDAGAICEIYKPYVEESAISFETQAPTQKDFQGRISETTAAFPWLVFEDENLIKGYAYAGPFKSRCAYSWSVESTVYVRKEFHGNGIGKLLYTDLLRRLHDLGAVNVIGGIALPNEASVAMHESLGFKNVARFKDVGFKLGKWWDVGYWQLQFQKPIEPKPLQRICSL